eukprot:Skav230785  [mRNA]  locus=scaffold1168:15325:15999:- [translate_table: standard]
MRKDGIYFFYYAGHGSEIDGSFHFIPKGARDEQDCIPIGIVMAHFDEFAGFGCQVIFCINACRDREHLQSPINKAYDNEYGKANRYYILFSTSSGEDVPLQDHQDVFKKVVEESMHLFKSDNVLSVLEQMFDEIGKLDSQQNPRLLCGGLRDPSSRASSGSNFSFAMPGNWLDRLQGHCCAFNSCTVGGCFSFARRGGMLHLIKDASRRWLEINNNQRQPTTHT